MSKITVYEKPTCSTYRSVVKILNEHGVEFEKVNYYIVPFTENKLRSLLRKMNLKPSELLRKNEDIYKNLKSKILSLHENEILKLMITNPDLVQRPIVEKGNKAILARPAEKIHDLF